MAASANMILRISTMADLAGLKAGLDMLVAFGGKVKDAMAAVDAFADAHSRLSLDVSKMIESTRGLISAQDAYQTANKLSAAGINATAAQLEGLGKKATEYAQATGQDIPSALNQMTQAVIAGSERGLRQFGVELDGSTDKTKNAQAALNQFSKEMEGFGIQVDSTSNTLEALGNNLSDAANRIMEVVGASQALASPFYGLNNALADFNAMMERSANGAETLARTLRGTLYEAVASIARFFGADETAETFETAARNVARMESQAPQKGQVMEFSEAEAYGERGAGRRGGGRRKASTAEMTFTEEEVFGEDIGSIVDRQQRNMAAMMDYTDQDIEAITGIGATDEMIKKLEGVDSLQEKIADRVMKLQAIVRGVAEERAINADPQVRAEMLRLEREETLLFYDQSLNYADRFGEAWSSSLKSVSAGAMTAMAVQNGLGKAISMVATAAINGGKLTVSAVADMVKGVALALGIESTIKAAFELAEAVAEKASTFGIGGNTHLAAAAQYAITAALAYAVAGGAAGISSAAGGGKSASMPASANSGSYGSPGYSGASRGSNQTNVTIEITGEAGDIFRVVKKENDKRSYSGQQSFATA